MIGDPKAASAKFDLHRRLVQAPFGFALGLTAGPSTSGVAVTLAVSSPLRSRENPGMVCEGFLTAAADQVGAAAVAAVVGINAPMATLAMDLTFIRQSADDAISFDGTCLGSAGGLGHARINARQGDGELVVTGTLTFAMGKFPGATVSQELFEIPQPEIFDGSPIGHFEGANSWDAFGMAENGTDVLLPLSSKIIGSRLPVAIHGGVIAAALLMGARRQCAGGRMRLSNASVNFLRAARPQDLCVQSNKRSYTNRTKMMHSEATQDGGERLVAMAATRLFAE